MRLIVDHLPLSTNIHHHLRYNSTGAILFATGNCVGLDRCHDPLAPSRVGNLLCMAKEHLLASSQVSSIHSIDIDAFALHSMRVHQSISRSDGQPSFWVLFLVSVCH